MTNDPTQVTHKIDPNQREDLRNVYLAIHRSAIVAEIPQVAAELKLKPRYVKELIGILETHADNDGDAFVIINARSGEKPNDGPHDWYQTSHTVDDHDEDEAMHWFDRHFPVQATPVPAQDKPAPANATKDNNPADLPLCLCGCMNPVNSRKRNYRPGHDARHAGQIGKALGGSGYEPGDESWTAYLGLLPTAALQGKADTMARRIKAKLIAKAEASVKGIGQEIRDRIAKVEFEDGHVKRGRWSYDAKRNTTSGAVTYTDKKGEQVADDKTAKTFVPAGSISDH